MLDLEDRLDELSQLGLHQRMRMVSGPQGPRVVLEGRPVLLLCSGNALGLADHPRVRQAAADAAMRWGVGAGAARVSCGTMTLHRRLEERLASFTGRRAALLFGSGSLANLGVIPALARRGEVVLHDELSHSSIRDGCRLSGADVVAYRHGDVDHLQWALRQCDGRAALIATDGMFGMDGDVAPLADIVELARHFDARVLVDEAHALGALGPGGRGAVAEAGPGGRGGRDHRHAGQGARRLRRVRRLRPRDRPLPRAQRPHAAGLHGAAAGGRGRRDGRAGPAGGAAAPGGEAAGQRRRAARRPRPRGLRRVRRRRPRRPARGRRRRAGRPDRRARAGAGRVRRGRAPAGGARGHRARAAGRHGLPHPRRAARRRPHPRPRGVPCGFRPGAGVPVAAAQLVYDRMAA